MGVEGWTDWGYVDGRIGGVCACVRLGGGSGERSGVEREREWSGARTRGHVRAGSAGGARGRLRVRARAPVGARVARCGLLVAAGASVPRQIARTRRNRLDPSPEKLLAWVGCAGAG